MSLTIACGGAQKDPVKAGSSALVAGDLVTAREFAEEALEEHPKHRPALELMAEIHRTTSAQFLDQGSLEEAMNEREAAAKTEPSRTKKAEDWAAVAEIAVDLGESEAAIVYGESAITADPSSLKMRRFVGNLHDEAGNVVPAISHYLYVWEADRKDTNLALRLAHLYVSLGRHEDAEAIYYSILETDPKLAQALLGMAEVQEKLGHVDAARRTFKRAVKAHRKNPGVMFRYAEFLARNGSPKTAAKWRKRAEKALPGVKRRRMRKLK